MAGPTLRLLVALDFSECSRVALSAALTLAERAAPVEIVVLTVLEPQPVDGEGLKSLEHAVNDLRKLVEATRAGRPTPAGVTVRYAAAEGNVAQEIAAQALSHGVDVVVLGTHGRTGLNRLIVGSVAEAVMRLAPCSVLTVKPSGQLAR